MERAADQLALLQKGVVAEDGARLVEPTQGGGAGGQLAQVFDRDQPVAGEAQQGQRATDGFRRDRVAIQRIGQRNPAIRAGRLPSGTRLPPTTGIQLGSTSPQRRTRPMPSSAAASVSTLSPKT